MADDPPAGVPEWIVTYGDMMSLLLTFFIMLVSLSEVKGNAKYQAMIESVMKYMGINAGYKSGPQAPSGEGFPLSGLVEKLQTLGSFTNSDRGKGGVKIPGPKGDDLRVFRGRDGTSISVGGPLVFSPNSAELAPEALEVLKTISSKLAGKPNKIDIRGHTSRETPPAGDNIELSYERARKVLDVMQQQGIQRERMRISAAAETEPLPPSADKQAVQLNRVEIFVLDAYAREFVGPRDVPE